MQVSATTWNTLSKLLDEALDLDPAARDSWLERLRATQPQLAPAVLKLLAAHASSETADVLAQLPSLDGLDSAARISTLGPGDRIGPYRLKRELGSGGMADVWLAERADGAFTREVALKLPLNNRLRRDLAQRFARERDILARLEHPHIARFYDAGVSEDGLSYLAMEYVDGQPITAYCDEHRLTLRQRLQLFSQVLSAVQYAHANLVIHRDLKPSNILVTTDGQVRLLDFGIAKLLADSDTTHETQLTQLSGRAMTPDYASPEQIKGDPLTIATDIYSLGVVLYELLAGQRAYRLKVQSPAQLEQAIIAADPPRPSANTGGHDAAEARCLTAAKLMRALSGDLDTIVLKALSKTPTERYATIAAFAEDLQRYCDGRPAIATRPSPWHRLKKFVRRNALAVGATVAVTLLLLSATLVSLWQARIAREQAVRAEQVKRYVLSIFEDADINAGAGRKTSAADLLLEAHKRLTATPVEDPAIAVELLSAIGFSLGGLGEYQQAVPVLEEATRIASSRLGDAHPRTIAAQLVYGEALMFVGQNKNAAQMLDAAERGMRRIDDPVGLVQALRWQSNLRVVEGRYDEAIAFATQAVQLGETRLSAAHKRVLMEAYGGLANALWVARKQGRLPAAERAYTLAREVYANRSTAPVLQAQSLYATAQIYEGNAVQGLSELKAVIPRQIDLLGPDHNDVALSYGRLAVASAQRGDPLTAIDSMRQVLRIESVTSGGKPTVGIGLQHFNIGVTLMNARRYGEAESELRIAETIYAQFMSPKDFHSHNVQSAIALLLVRTGRLQQAEVLFHNMLSQPIENPIQTAIVKMRLGALRRAQGQHAEAQRLLEEAVEFFSKKSLAPQQSSAQVELAGVLLDLDQPAAAVELLDQARMVFEKLHPNGSPDRADTMMTTAKALLALNRKQDALEASNQAVAFWNSFDRANRSAGVALLWHARALSANGDDRKAVDAMLDARKILATTRLTGDEALLKETQRQLTARAGRSGLAAAGVSK